MDTMDSSQSTVKVNDFVWAKLARYPPWPAVVMKPDPYAPPKHKNSHWIYFFGTHDYAWVEERHIKPFQAYREQFKATYKRADLVEAVEEIEEILENIQKDPGYKIQFIKYTRKERKTSSTRSRQSSENSVESRKRLLKERNTPTPRKRSRSFITTEYDSDDKDEMTINQMSNPTSISPKTFGFLAANVCDEGILKNLIKSGHRTQVWSSSLAMSEELQNYANRQGVYFKICKTRRELVRDCDIIFNHQSDPDQVKALMKEFGVHDEHDNLLDGKGYVEMTCIDPDVSTQHCKLVENKGGTYVEAMVQGNVAEANRGELVLITAGNMAPFNECSSCFKAMSKSTVYLRTIGSATKAHMLLESLRAVLLAGYTEFFSLSDKWGMEPATFVKLMELSSMSCEFFKSKGELIMEKKFSETEEPVQVLQRNLLHVRKWSNILRHPTPMASSAFEIFKHARRLGYDNQDCASIYNRTRY